MATIEDPQSETENLPVDGRKLPRASEQNELSWPPNVIALVRMTLSEAHWLGAHDADRAENGDRGPDVTRDSLRGHVADLLGLALRYRPAAEEVDDACDGASPPPSLRRKYRENAAPRKKFFCPVRRRDVED